MGVLDQPFTALVIGASGGIGAALAASLRDHPHCTRLETLSRRADGIDLTDERTVADGAERYDDQTFDMVLNASGVLDINGAGPEKAFREIEQAVMTRAFEVNAVGAALAY
ncbi:MAG: Rossmann-fold NAD(P)-binding domain-containing protein, partial [Hyphococcus sp.]